MDKVTDCAKLYSEFGIIVSRFAGRYLKEIYYKIHRAKVNCFFRPVVFL